MFPARESFVSDIQAGDGKIDNLFYSVVPFLLLESAIGKSSKCSKWFNNCSDIKGTVREMYFPFHLI
jgi:hypothetical protein